jgi:hypothetical protein
MFCSDDIEKIVSRFVEEEENNNSTARSKQNQPQKEDRLPN